VLKRGFPLDETNWDGLKLEIQKTLSGPEEK
jgi:hypothetical protein